MTENNSDALGKSGSDKNKAIERNIQKKKRSEMSCIIEIHEVGICLHEILCDAYT
jgi:hypothetical protein